MAKRNKNKLSKKEEAEFKKLLDGESMKPPTKKQVAQAKRDLKKIAVAVAADGAKKTRRKKATKAYTKKYAAKKRVGSIPKRGAHAVKRNKARKAGLKKRKPSKFQLFLMNDPEGARRWFGLGKNDRA
jgi:hypothetical protein